MIHPDTFNFLMLIAIGLFVYSVIDHRNRLYANIILTFLSGLTFIYLGTAVSTGSVLYESSASLGDLLKLIGMFAFAYCGIMTYEVIDEISQKNAVIKEQQERPA